MTQSEAARIAGVSQTTILQRMRRWGVTAEEASRMPKLDSRQGGKIGATKGGWRNFSISKRSGK